MLSIAGGANFAFLQKIPAQIRWIDKSGTPGYLSVGLEFLEIAENVREQLAKFKVPRRITFLDALPVSDSGKILKRALKEMP